MSHNAATDISTFQGLIQTLQAFWAEQGCVIMQPYDNEMGAGTFHPATFFTCPWGQSLGVRLMFSHVVVRRMAVMVKTQTACNTIISSKSC